MSLTEAEGRWDGAFIAVCEELVLPKDECICGYHEYDGIQSRRPTDDEMAEVKAVHQKAVAEAYERDPVRTYWEEEVA